MIGDLSVDYAAGSFGPVYFCRRCSSVLVLLWPSPSS